MYKNFCFPSIFPAEFRAAPGPGQVTPVPRAEKPRRRTTIREAGGNVDENQSILAGTTTRVGSRVAEIARDEAVPCANRVSRRNHTGRRRGNRSGRGESEVTGNRDQERMGEKVN